MDLNRSRSQCHREGLIPPAALGPLPLQCPLEHAPRGEPREPVDARLLLEQVDESLRAKGGADPGLEHDPTEGLGDIVRTARVERPGDLAFVFLHGQEENRDVSSVLVTLELTTQLEAGHSWHVDVQQNDARPRLTGALQPRQRGLGVEDPLYDTFEIEVDEGMDVRIIIHDEQGFRSLLEVVRRHSQWPRSVLSRSLGAGGFIVPASAPSRP